MRFQNQVAHCGGVRAIRSYNRNISFANGTLREWTRFCPARIQNQLVKFRPHQIAVVSIVRDITLKKCDLMPLPGKRIAQPAQESRGAIPPGGADRKPKYPQLHPRALIEKPPRFKGTS